MNWIIWTCGWMLSCTIAEYIDSKRRQITGNPEPDGATAGFLMLIIWIIGMVKFA
jgi:hypothetical protein